MNIDQAISSIKEHCKEQSTALLEMDVVADVENSSPRALYEKSGKSAEPLLKSDEAQKPPVKKTVIGSIWS